MYEGTFFIFVFPVFGNREIQKSYQLLIPLKPWGTKGLLKKFIP